MEEIPEENKKQDLTQNQLNALGLIAHQLMLARQQLSQPMPLQVLAVTFCQDAIESFAGIAADYTNTPVKAKATFDDWLAAIERATNRAVTNRRGLESLNKARVNIKHHGVFCDQNQIPTFVAAAEAFVSEYSQLLFGRSLHEIDRTDLISHPVVYEHMRKARNALSEEQFGQVLIECASAMVHIEKQGRFRLVDGRRPFSYQPKSSLRFHYQNEWNSDLKAMQKSMDEEFEAMSWRLLLISMGVDFRDIARFAVISPIMVSLARATGLITKETTGFIKAQKSRSSAEFAIWFVTDVALRFQSFDAEWIAEYGLYEKTVYPMNISNGSSAKTGREVINPSPTDRR